MIPQEADQTHIEYGFPVIQREFVVLKFACSLLARLIDFSCHIPLQSILTLYSTACELLLRHNPLRFVLNNHFRNQNVLSKTPLQELLPCCSTLHGGKHSQAGTVLTQECCTVMHGFYKSDLMARFMEIMLPGLLGTVHGTAVKCWSKIKLAQNACSPTYV